MQKLKTVGVMGSGETATGEATIVGDSLARLGVNLLTGGGAGQMRAVAEAFVAVPGRVGHSIGVIPASRNDPTRPKNPAYPNPFVEVAIRTHLGGQGTDPKSRNHINILSCDLVIFLFGSSGTLSEAKLAKVYGKPRRLFLLATTQEERDCTTLLDEFRSQETLTTLAELKEWLGSAL